MPIPLIIPLVTAAISAGASIYSASKQNKAAKKLREQGPEGLSPSMKKALNRTRIQANASVTPFYTAQKQILEENAADASDAIKQASGNAAEVIAGVSGVNRQRGQAMQRLGGQDQIRKDKFSDDLNRLEMYAGQVEDRNRDQYNQELMGLLRARDQNYMNAANRVASTAIYGMQNGAFERKGGDVPPVSAQQDSVPDPTRTSDYGTGAVTSYDQNGNISGVRPRGLFNRMINNDLTEINDPFGRKVDAGLPGMQANINPLPPSYNDRFLPSWAYRLD